MSLVCGGRGPCCHIGYPHRHCEHCDMVVPTMYYQHYYHPQPWYGTFTNAQLGIGLQSQGINPLQALANQFNAIEEPKK